MKYLTTVALLLVSAASLYADDAKKEETKSSFAMTGIVYGTAYNSVTKDEQGSYSAARFNPSLALKKGNLEGFIELEYNATFGGNNATDDSSAENVGLGAGKTNIELAQAFFKNTVDALPSLAITAGIAPYSFPLIWDDNGPLFSAAYSFGSADLALYYLKAYEGNNNTSSDDSQIYIADLSIKAGESVIRPAVFITQSKISADSDVATPGVKYRDKAGIIAALSADLSFGSFGLGLSGAYSKGKGNDGYTVSIVSGEEVKTLNGESIKYSAYAFDIAPSYKISDTVKIGAFFTGVSGDSNGQDDGKDSSFLNATLDGADSGINSFRLFIIEDGGSFTTHSDVANAGKYSNTFGYYAAGLSVDLAKGPFTSKIQGAYVRSGKAPADASKEMGYEIDISIGYEMTRGVTLYGEAAFLKTGNFFKEAGLSSETQNAGYLNAGVKYEM